MKVDGYEVQTHHVLEELRNVVKNYPLFPGGTISHRTAEACRRLGLIVRNSDGDWIPTARGIKRHALSELEEKP